MEKEQGDQQNIIEAWIEVENDPFVVASDVEDMLFELEEGTHLVLESEQRPKSLWMLKQKHQLSLGQNALPFDTIRCFLKTNGMKTLIKFSPCAIIFLFLLLNHNPVFKFES